MSVSVSLLSLFIAVVRFVTFISGNIARPLPPNRSTRRETHQGVPQVFKFFGVTRAGAMEVDAHMCSSFSVINVQARWFKFFGVQRASAMEVNAHEHLYSTMLLRMASFHQHRMFLSPCSIFTNYQLLFLRLSFRIM